MRKKTKVLLSTSADDTQNEFRFSIEFFVFQENGDYIAYCPSLDLSSSGGTFNEAVGNFYEAFQLYVECCVESGTLVADLVARPGNKNRPLGSFAS